MKKTRVELGLLNLTAKALFERDFPLGPVFSWDLHQILPLVEFLSPLPIFVLFLMKE
jgi:hypothetical protein